ncbi:MAG TPA: S24 family peptidase [Gammaproteobacteria bacterium]|nr:S24 family peptidase [Gammaproteobacteria bacterium]
MENKEIRLINLHKLLKESKTAASLAYAANTSPAYISQILSKKAKGSVGHKLARKLELAAGKPKGWLDIMHDEEAKPTVPIKQLPFVEPDKIHEWYSGNTGTLNTMISTVSEENRVDTTGLFCSEMTGDAMMSPMNVAASICPGDIIIIDKNATPSFGDIVLIKIKQSVKVRQLLRDGDEQILKAFNPNYPIIQFTNRIKILGVVIEIRRKMTSSRTRSS